MGASVGSRVSRELADREARTPCFSINVQMTSPVKRAMSLRTSIKSIPRIYSKRGDVCRQRWLLETGDRAVNRFVRLENLDELGDGEETLDLVGNAGES